MKILFANVTIAHKRSIGLDAQSTSVNGIFKCLKTKPSTKLSRSGPFRTCQTCNSGFSFDRSIVPWWEQPALPFCPLSVESLNLFVLLLTRDAKQNLLNQTQISLTKETRIWVNRSVRELLNQTQSLCFISSLQIFLFFDLSCLPRTLLFADTESWI
jgi:hypothetical protein